MLLPPEGGTQNLLFGDFFVNVNETVILRISPIGGIFSEAVSEHGYFSFPIAVKIAVDRNRISLGNSQLV